MTAVATSPTEVFEAFWAMSNHFKALIDHSHLTAATPGVHRWDVQLLPAHEIVTFERTAEGQVSASWVTVNPGTRDEDFNEVLFDARSFDLMFAGALHG